MGFLIDAVTHRIDLGPQGLWIGAHALLWMCKHLAEIISSALMLQVSSMGLVGCRHASGKRLNFQACR
jgi:hypothetical protein